MPTQAEKAVQFETLHRRKQVFVVGNPWDAGTARILAGLGFEALSTTSAGLAFALGRRDGTASVSRDEALANARSIVEATALPVAADLENGYGHTPEAAAETIRLAAEAGLVGGSIEDATSDPQIRSTTSTTPWNGSRLPRRLRMLSNSRSCLWHAQRTFFTTARTLTTPSAACRRLKPRAPRFFMLRESLVLKTSVRSALPWQSR